MTIGRMARTSRLAGPGAGPGHGATAGKRAPTDSMFSRYLRSCLELPSNMPLDVMITTTTEYRAFVDPALVWQWGMKVTPEHAHAACRLMLEDMRAGKSIDWRMEAKGYLARARAQREAAPGPNSSDEMSSLAEPLPVEPGVCEPDASEEQGGHEANPDEPPVATVDPGFDVPVGFDTNIDDLLRELRELAGDLDDSFEREAKIAARLLELSSLAMAGLISLGIVVGGFAAAVNVSADGAVVVTWTAGAAGAEYERRVGRAAAAAAELEATLREAKAIEAQLAQIDAGNGAHWKVRRERWSKRAIPQIDGQACGAACGEMMLDARSIRHPSQKALAFAMRGSDDIVGVGPDRVALMLEEVAPEWEWMGGFASTHADDPRRTARAFTGLGPWIAQVKSGNGHHYVFVEAMDGEGTMTVLDPWRWPDDDKQLVRPRGCGTTYTVRWPDFDAVWNGNAIWCRGKKQ